MNQQQEVIRECTNPQCAFRFPEAITSTRGESCPLCHTPTRVVAHTGTSHSWNPPVKPEVSGPSVEALLDNIRSTFNVGSMLRTADGAGLTHLHLCGLTPTPENTKVTKTSLGAEHSVPWTYHPNALHAARAAKDRGMRLWALEVTPTASPLFNITSEIAGPPICVVVGNEVSGIDPGVLEICDKSIWIPMQGFKRSLNVAIAFSIMIYFLRYAASLPLPDSI